MSEARESQHHCDTYVKELGRICDKPATVHIGQMYRCSEHDPYALTPARLTESQDMTSATKNENFYTSMKTHQIKTIGSAFWFSLVVTLTQSDNPYLSYPVRGVIRSCEQGVHLGLIKTVFHALNEDGTLGAPVEVRNPVFTFDGGEI